jgi:hypothetical protein
MDIQLHLLQTQRQVDDKIMGTNNVTAKTAQVGITK